MKCKYCNGEIGLEDRTCPYCGRPNEEAIRHFTDMADYQNRYAKTEADVVGTAKRYGQIIPRAIAIVLLLILTAVMAVIAENASAFPDYARRRAAQKNPAVTIETIEGYISRRDYISLASYFEYNDIRTYDSPFSAYSDLRWTTNYYKEIMLRLERLYLHEDVEKWAKNSAPDDFRSLCQTLDYFFDALENKGSDAGAEHQECLDDMRAQVMDMLRVCFGLEGEDAEKFLAMSDNRKAAYLEEVILGV